MQKYLKNDYLSGIYIVFCSMKVNKISKKTILQNQSDINATYKNKTGAIMSDFLCKQAK